VGHDQRHSLKDYWSREEQYSTPFYSNVMARDRFFHIRFHFENNAVPPKRDDPDYDRLWKIRKISDTLNNNFGELYNPTEHLALDEVIVLYKGRVVFRQYIPKKHIIWHQILQTLQVAGLRVRYERVVRYATVACHSSNNSNAWNSAASYSKS
jgi:hypothetical protein